MLTWSKVNQIITAYDLEKGPIRRFFNTRSSYLEALSSCLEKKNLDAPLTMDERYALIKQCFEQFPGVSTKLSYTSAKQVVSLCMNNNNSQTMFTMLQLLYAQQGLHAAFLTLFFSLSLGDAKLIAEQLKLLLMQHAFSGTFLQQTAEQSAAIEYYLAKLQENVKAYRQAERWYQKAANNHRPQALLTLVQFYCRHPLIRNAHRFDYLRQAAASENQSILKPLKLLAQSQLDVAWLLATFYEEKKQKQKAVPYYRMASQLGSLKADVWLANDYTQQQAMQQAVNYYRRAANKDHLPSIQFLCQHYQTGLGPWIKKDYKKAIHYARQAVELGSEAQWEAIKTRAQSGEDPLLQYEIGQFYCQAGKIDQALPWLIGAAHDQQIDAMHYLRDQDFDAKTLYTIAQHFQHSYANEEQAHDFYHKAAQKGNKLAAVYLGDFYIQSKAPANQLKAFHYYQLAARSGYQPAEAILERLANEGGLSLSQQVSDYYRNHDSARHQFWRTKTSCSRLKTEQVKVDASRFDSWFHPFF